MPYLKYQSCTVENGCYISTNEIRFKKEKVTQKAKKES